MNHSDPLSCMQAKFFSQVRRYRQKKMADPITAEKGESELRNLILYPIFHRIGSPASQVGTSHSDYICQIT